MLKNTTKNKKMFAHLSVTFLVLTLFQMPVFSQENATRTGAGTFALSAVKEDRITPQVKTAYHCPSPLPMQAVPPPANMQKVGMDQAFINASPPPPVLRPPGAPIGQQAPQTGAVKKSNSLEDCTINWSPWMGVLANRWFSTLQMAEEASGLRFHTARPALIQFTCYADGHIGNIVLKQSSGIPYYDRLQVATLLAAAPLPPFPTGTERKSLTLVQGWESHKKEPGDREFEPAAFAARFPQEKVSRWVTSQQ